MNFFKRRGKDFDPDDAFIDDIDDGGYYGGENSEDSKNGFSWDGDENASEASGVAFSGGTSPVAMKLIKPKGYDDGPEIADFLASGSTVILNVELLDKNATKRILDFLLGATHVLGGTMNMVARGTFVFAPRSVGISDLTAEAEEETDDESAE